MQYEAKDASAEELPKAVARMLSVAEIGFVKNSIEELGNLSTNPTGPRFIDKQLLVYNPNAIQGPAEFVFKATGLAVRNEVLAFRLVAGRAA